MIYRFEDYALDAGRRELRRGKTIYAVEPQVFDVLEYLIRHRARLITRDELWKAVWHGRVVSEAAIDTRVSAARAAIGDSGSGQRLIRTVRKRGFRFVGSLIEETSPSGISHPAEEIRHRAALADYPTVGVIPFTESQRRSRPGFAR